MANDTAKYIGADGKPLDTGSAGGISLALADIGRRLSGLESRPEPTASSGTDTARVERLETVAGVFFRNELEQYDTARADAARDAGNK